MVPLVYANWSLFTLYLFRFLDHKFTHIFVRLIVLRGAHVHQVVELEHGLDRLEVYAVPFRHVQHGARKSGPTRHASSLPAHSSQHPVTIWAAGWEAKFMTYLQCDQIWWYIGLWATFQSPWQQLICPNIQYSLTIFVKVSKSSIFLVKSFLGNFYRHLVTFYSSHCIH